MIYMGKKINVVNLNSFENTAPEQPTNDAEEMSKIKNDIQQEETPEAPSVVEQPKEIEPKAKPKRKPPAKKKIEEVKEEVITPTPIIEEKPEEKPEEKKQTKIKTVELVSCPDCNKEMSKKTLRYSHDKNCTGKPVVREEIPVKRRAPVKVKQTTPPEEKEKYISIPEEIIQQEINRRVKEQKDARIKAKDERIKKLAMNIV